MGLSQSLDCVRLRLDGPLVLALREASLPFHDARDQEPRYRDENEGRHAHTAQEALGPGTVSLREGLGAEAIGLGAERHCLGVIRAVRLRLDERRHGALHLP